ncbi:MAG: hypothetical protein M3Z05_22750 [Gemmatimonadota bacterium]|nr:hypothetical protein [Gemmatimonadota bacterium]
MMLAIGRLTLAAIVVAIPVTTVGAQAIVAAWGNVEGVRLDGQVFPFETSLCTTNDSGRVMARTAKERQQPRLSRIGNRRTVTTRLGALSIVEIIEDGVAGQATVDVRFTADSATSVSGFVCVDVSRASFPAHRVTAQSIEFENPTSLEKITIEAIVPVEIVDAPSRRDTPDVHRLMIPVLAGKSEPGRSAQLTFAIRVSGPIDHSPVTLTIDASNPGRVFDGLGGNFRIQNPRVDPAVIAYNLANLRIAWARVELPWRSWDNDTLVDPSARDTAHLDPKVRAAMEMARTAAANGAPVILSAWFPPQWAVIGPLPRGGRAPDGTWGSQLDPARMERIYASLTSYLLYLKRHYGVEAAMFSFNESDLGIDVRQTPQEHANLIKGLGAYMRGKGLKTTMLLGDVSDATPTRFIKAAMEDPATRPYIGAVSYHAWRGWSDSLLIFWGDAAKRLDVPLLVGEGSTDAGAYRYPAIFLEPEFALAEIELYVRMLALSEPRSILQWQLTSDYSLLAGGGVYGDTTTLRPTQRFWNLKQLASTPERVHHLPMQCSRPIHCAALGNASEGSLALHLVNTGASRPTTITGIPDGVKSLRVWVTNAERAMTEGTAIAVEHGRAQLTLDAASYVSLIGMR